MLEIDVSDQDALQNAISRRHPDYDAMHKHWIFCEATYKGGREWFSKKTIHQYYKEGQTEFDDRLKRAYRFPHTSEVVNLIVKYLFKSDVARNWDDAPKYVKAFWKRATLSGLDIKEFMRVVATKSSVFGRIWVFIDSTKSKDIITKQDERKSKSRCYAYIVSPIDVLDIGYGELGELNWMLVREYKRDDKDPIHSSGEMKIQYRLWTPDMYYVFEIADNSKVENNKAVPIQLSLPGVLDYNMRAPGTSRIMIDLIDSGPNPIGVIPAVPIDHVIGDNKYSAPGLVDDIAYLDKAVANYLSNLDAIIQDQTFSQLAMPAQNVMPGDDAYEAVRELGTKRVFLYDGESGAKPEYLSPDPKQATMIVTVINKIINEIYHTTGLAGERTKEDNAVGIDNSSGVAKAYDFERLNSLLITKSESCETAEKKIIKLLALYNDDEASIDPETDTFDEPDTCILKYADTFDTRSLYDEFTVAERLELIDAPKTVRQQQMLQVIDKLFPALKEDLKASMIEDMEASWPITGVDQVAITAVADGNPSAKFPAKLTSTENPGMKPMPLPPPPVAGGAAKKPAAKASKGKNAGTQNRQGQVTSKTK